MTRLAQLLSEAPNRLDALIADEEGFGIPGTIPTLHGNPGDLRHAPGETHPLEAPNSVGSFATAEQGWGALERQLELYASRSMTLRDVIYEFAPPSENDSEAYLQFVCDGLGCSPDISVAEALKIK